VIYQYSPEAIHNIRGGIANLRQHIDNLEEHIRTDHKSLRRVWRLHSPSTVFTFNGKPTCLGCEQIYPCLTIRTLLEEEKS